SIVVTASCSGAVLNEARVTKTSQVTSVEA
ncbi:MAG: hypothetical protein QOG28_6776, partial [Trebonia sp.]|nr:hypothetical protein [Trebonia sp.]